MKKLYKILLLFLLCSIIGCNSILDILPDDKPELEDAFKDRYNTEKYLYTCYKYIPKFADPMKTLGLTGGGDIKYSDRDMAQSMPSGPPATMLAFFKGQQVSDPYMNFWDGRNGASTNLWQAIRHCNIFIEKIKIENGGPKDLEEDLRNQWTAEAKVLKAFFHFYLLQLYGPIPIMDEAIPISATGEQVNVYREPIDDVVDYIVTTIDDALGDLPTLKNLDAVSEYGRITKTIALMIKAKTLVLAASPLYNNNNYYVGIKDNRGIELFSQGNAQKYWEKALEACEEASLSAQNDGNYIYKSIDAGGGAISDVNPGNISDTTKSILNIRQAVTESWNSEIIWAINENVTNLQKFSTMLSDNEWMNDAGRGSTDLGQRHGPTINVVELFYSSNGIPIEEDKEWANNNWYRDRYTTKLPDKEHSKYYIKEGQETAVLHYNRSNRFYASVGFQGGIWEGRNVRQNQSATPNFLNGMGCGIKRTGGYGSFSVTGYLAKKLSHLKTTYTETGIQLVAEKYSFPIFRLADLYLLLAECLNEVGGPQFEDSKGNNAYYYIDMIRERVGMEGVVKSWENHALPEFINKPKSKEGLREIIRRERINELAFEGHFYYDIRRWLLAEELYNKPILGWNSNGNNIIEFFNITILDEPKFSMRDYLMPIRTNTLLQNKNLIQNPGW